MGEPFYCFSLRYAGCALSVQNIYFYFAGAKTVVYSCQTRYWQGFENGHVKRLLDVTFRATNFYRFVFQKLILS